MWRNCQESSALLQRGPVLAYSTIRSSPRCKTDRLQWRAPFQSKHRILLILRWRSNKNLLCVRTAGSIKLNTIQFRWESPPCHFQQRCWSELCWEEWNLQWNTRSSALLANAWRANKAGSFRKVWLCFVWVHSPIAAVAWCSGYSLTTLVQKGKYAPSLLKF